MPTSRVMRQYGATLIELMLVLVLGAIMLYVGMSQYFSFRAEQDVLQLKANVDAVFQSMGQYYQANCRNFTIFPEAPALHSSVKVPLTTLQSERFLTQPLVETPLIDKTTGYITQFNAATSTRQVFFSYAPASLVGQPTPIKKSDSVIVWRAQVAIKLADASKLEMYRALLAANCISELVGTTVMPCGTSTSQNGYLVWERLPSFASPNMTTGLWQSTAVLKQFNQQYTNDDNYAYSFYSGNSSENYYCGG